MTTASSASSRPAPRPGEHTDDVLDSLLGLPADALDRPSAEGAIA